MTEKQETRELGALPQPVKPEDTILNMADALARSLETEQHLTLHQREYRQGQIRAYKDAASIIKGTRK